MVSLEIRAHMGLFVALILQKPFWIWFAMERHGEILKMPNILKSILGSSRQSGFEKEKVKQDDQLGSYQHLSIDH